MSEVPCSSSSGGAAPPPEVGRETAALGAPPVDRVREDLAMARIRGALFGEATPATLERYALLQKLGEGSYGAVYSAWDPRLDRRIALKVLHAGATAELEREARALAQLAHPNIVAVHDVGESDGQLFLAMEFVDGESLSTLRVGSLGWRRIVAIYRQAAAGLAAAHEAGIVHRDFKPANAILGHDGRVRVLDFGLARPGLASPEPGGPVQGTRPAGTPRYMAPEQHHGEAVDARTDQYCFCAALWEALHGAPAFEGDDVAELLRAKATAPTPPPSSPAPARVTRLLQRGLSPDPAARFESMHELDAALGRSLQRRRTTVAAVTAVAVALGLGIVVGGSDDPCAGSDEPPARWSDETARELAEAFTRTGLPHAQTSGATARDALDQWATQWGRARADACQLHAQGVQSAEGLDLRTACLERQRTHFDALLDVLLEADATAVDRAVEATASLPDPSACADVEALRRDHPIAPVMRARVGEASTTLARARAELEAGHYQRAADLAAPVRDACELDPLDPLDHVPTCVEAKLLVGDGLGFLGQHEAAVRHLRAAAIEAQRARLPIAFGRAAASLTWELGEVDAVFERALTWADVGEAALDGTRALKVQVSLLNNKASVLATAGRWDEATAVHEALLERIVATRGEHDPLTMMVHANLGNIDNQLGRADAAEADYARALEIGEAALGRTHPRVLTTRQNRAGMRVQVGRIDEARAELREILAAQQDVLGPSHPDLVPTLTNLSMAELSGGDAEAALRDARAASARVVDIFGARSHLGVEAWLAESDALLALGRSAEAVRVCAHATSVAESTMGHEHTKTAYAARAWGHALRADGAWEDGTAKLEEAASIFAALEMDDEAKATRTDLAAPR